MNPAVLCFCEVGTATQPLTEVVMKMLQFVTEVTWSAAATEHRNPDIRFHYEDGSPYLTAWDANQCDCKHFRIMQDIFAHKEPRTAPKEIAPREKAVQ